MKDYLPTLFPGYEVDWTRYTPSPMKEVVRRAREEEADVRLRGGDAVGLAANANRLSLDLLEDLRCLQLNLELGAQRLDRALVEAEKGLGLPFTLFPASHPGDLLRFAGMQIRLAWRDSMREWMSPNSAGPRDVDDALERLALSRFLPPDQGRDQVALSRACGTPAGGVTTIGDGS